VACLPEFSALIKGYTRSATTTPTPEASTAVMEPPKQKPQETLTPVNAPAPVNGTSGGAAAAQQQEAANGTGKIMLHPSHPP
jgi:hypothetical protein